MRDWSALVRPHLASLRVDERRRLEIGDELAAHLEDTYESALRRGSTEAEAMACAMERVPDWRALAAAVERSADEDSTMTRQAMTVLLPGTTIELSEVAGPKGKLFKLIREAAAGWDGREPVRPFPDLSKL